MEEIKPLISLPKTLTSSRLLRLLAILFSICTLLYFTTSLTLIWINSSFTNLLITSSSRLSAPPLSLDHIVFGLASTAASWPKHRDYVKIWWKPGKTRGCVYLDSYPATAAGVNNNGSNSKNYDTYSSSLLPPICVSSDTSRFHYSHKHGYRSFIRVARVVFETVVGLGHDGAQWYVFGDGDTVFFPDNLVKTLAKYDHQLWYYIGSNSEIYEQNRDNSFDMAFWGAGFAVSASLAKVLAKLFDSCLERYPHLYGADGRVYSCLAELGVGLTREPGFHQVDLRGNLFGLLTTHPLNPLLSLPHLGQVDPIFPNMTPINALHHLFKTATVDPDRILQQTVCYDRWFSWTISVSWGYAVQVFDRHLYLPDVLRVQDTFSSSPWKKGAAEAGSYMFSTSPLQPDPCRRSTVFFLDRVNAAGGKMIVTKYRRMLHDNCTFDPMASPKKLEEIVVFSRKSNLDINQLKAPRRECCDVLPSSAGSRLELSVRECKEDELIHIHA